MTLDNVSTDPDALTSEDGSVSPENRDTGGMDGDRSDRDRRHLHLADASVGLRPFRPGHTAVDGHRDRWSALTVENADLRGRLATLPAIEQAKGIVMGRYHVDEVVAFALLSRWSSHTNVKVRDLSRALVTAAPADASYDPAERSGSAEPTLEEILDWLGEPAGPPASWLEQVRDDPSR